MFGMTCCGTRSRPVEFGKLNSMRRLAFFTILLLMTGLVAFRSAGEAPIHGDNPQRDGIRWMTVEEAAEALQEEPRKVLVNVYTEWCGWCKHMDKTTFRDSHIIAYINKTFYPVKLNAEHPDPISIGDKTYKFEKGSGEERGFHQLVSTFTMGRMELPSNVFLDETMRVLQPFPGYKDPESFEMILTYYGNDHYLKTPYSAYQRAYVPLKQRMKPVTVSD